MMTTYQSHAVADILNRHGTGTHYAFKFSSREWAVLQGVNDTSRVRFEGQTVRLVAEGGAS